MRVGCGGMATAPIGSAPRANPLGVPALNGLAAPAKQLAASFTARRETLRSNRFRESVHVAMCDAALTHIAGPRDRPPPAPVLYSRHSPPACAFAWTVWRSTAACRPSHVRDPMVDCFGNTRLA